MQHDLPPLALSVRQPWAWAILHGGKVIENRSAGAIRAGGMECSRIALHAAASMTEKEYRWGVWRLERHGVRCPAPGALVRGAIIGAVEVVDIVSESDSEWFGGPCGLVLENPVAKTPRHGSGWSATRRPTGMAQRGCCLTTWRRGFGRFRKSPGRGNAGAPLCPTLPEATSLGLRPPRPMAGALAALQPAQTFQ